MRFAKTCCWLLTVLFLLPISSAAETSGPDLSPGPFTSRTLPQEPALPLQPGSELTAPLKTGDPVALSEYIEEVMALYHIPGLVGCVVQDGRLVWTGVYGYADIVAEVPAADSTVFMLASISKTFVATAVMQCWEDGLINLDANINTYLPFDVINPNHPLRAIKARHLLTHTSSIARNDPAWVPYIHAGADSPLALGLFLEDWLVPGGKLYLEDNYMSYAPGTGGQYSNIASALAAYLVECVTGISFEEFCQTNIFEPLGMDETSWFLANLDPTNIAMPTYYQADSYHQYGQYGFPIYPCGQLRSSAPQLARHLLAFMGLGEVDGARILETETAEMMRTVQYPGVPVFSGADFGLGWYRTDSSLGYLWGHNGGLMGVHTDMYCSLEEDWGMINLTNGDPGDGATLITNALVAFASEYVPTSAMLATFTVARRRAAAELVWQLGSPVTDGGFHVWRQEPGTERVRLTRSIISVRSSYTYFDTSPSPGEAEYLLQYVDERDADLWLGSASLEALSVPAAAVLAQNHPNPFNPLTTIQYELPVAGQVRVSVYDASGRLVAVLVDESRPAGEYDCRWDGNDLYGARVGAGTYFCRLQIGQMAHTIKMTLLK